MTEEISINVTQNAEAIQVDITAEGTVPRLHYGTGVPGSGLGATNDAYLDTARAWFYQKTGVSAWTLRGAMAISLSNSHVQFVCPDGVTRRAALSNLP